MTDIVERLRLVNACAAGCNGRCLECPDTVTREAADEIERLQAELGEAIERGNDWCDQAQKARAERDGAEALVERMHAQDALAIQAWKKANPGHGLRWPGNIRLSAWCLGEVANLEAERDAAITDADMQAREAGNIEHNARVLMAERDRLRAALQEIAGVMTGPTLHATDMAERMHGLARAALKEMGHE